MPGERVWTLNLGGSQIGWDSGRPSRATEPWPRLGVRTDELAGAGAGDSPTPLPRACAAGRRWRLRLRTQATEANWVSLLNRISSRRTLLLSTLLTALFGPVKRAVESLCNGSGSPFSNTFVAWSTVLPETPNVAPTSPQLKAPLNARPGGQAC